MESMGANLIEFVRNGLRRSLVPAQFAIACFAVGAMAAMPRSGDPVTLFPISNKGSNALPALISASDTRLMARGALPGSYVVSGSLPGIAELLLDHGVLALNAAVPGCGPNTMKRDDR
uniref:hypothetical protein n=1 Tax=uncultured Erythrobacter sp. TaxID=263913 RepID=UPI0026343796|nr:hypothetical protein [uncultured Erythrobacter sp.]